MSILKRTIVLGTLAGLGAVAVVVWRRKGHLRTPVIASVTINKPTHEVYDFYRQLARLPQFMDYLESVEVIDERHSTWTAKLPFGKTVQWNAEITEDRPGEVLAWKSSEDSQIQVKGRVTFTRTVGRDMTEVRAEIQLGGFGRAPSTRFARLFAKPQIKGDLRRLKQVMETGEVLYSDASAHRLPHAAQPADTLDTSPKIFVPNPTTAEKGVTP
ncbi:MAG TPA: SRPBCC family protein [Kofleriaceae bacterium]|nr:SRPBCC family protein [Kofleriaceae bacterium]